MRPPAYSLMPRHGTRRPMHQIASPYETLDDMGFTLQGFGTVSAQAKVQLELQTKADTFPGEVGGSPTPTFRGYLTWPQGVPKFGSSLPGYNW